MAEKKGKLAEIKTKANSGSIEDFINSVKEESKRQDSFSIIEMMKKATGEDPVLWGTSIIGFGNKRYKSPTSGREVDWFKIGFSPRKANLTLYLTVGMGQHSEKLNQLGKYKTGGGCIYINKLADVDLKVLQEMFEESYQRNSQE